MSVFDPSALVIVLTWNLRLSWTKSINAYSISGSAYSSNRYKTCAGYPASYGRELQDLETWRSWGWTELASTTTATLPMTMLPWRTSTGGMRACFMPLKHWLPNTAKSPSSTLCANGVGKIHRTRLLGYRMPGVLTVISRPIWPAIASILQMVSTSYLATNHYQHGDMDMLEVGNVNGGGRPPGDLTYYEQRTHFTAWALLKSHLLIETDLRNASSETL